MPAEFEVFSVPNCTRCEAAKTLLNDNNVEFVERSLEDPAELAELRRRAPRAMALSRQLTRPTHR
jgi:arsenate reductase-like glutaredoxin family protein